MAERLRGPVTAQSVQDTGLVHVGDLDEETIEIVRKILAERDMWLAEPADDRREWRAHKF